MYIVGIPMYGRMMHDKKGKKYYQPYGHPGDCNLSIGRKHLNELLLQHAEQRGVHLNFEHQLTDLDLKKDKALKFKTKDGGKTVHYKHLLATDGAYSVVRGRMQKTGRMNYSQHYVKHGYKELSIAPGTGDNKWKIEKDCLHIWPRNNFMMIALPNLDGSFTVTLFMAHEREDGEPADSLCNFNALGDDRAKIQKFFDDEFADLVPFLENPVDQYLDNPTGNLVEIKADPWNYQDSVVLMGDAAHAMVPFHGQGMNAAFQDTQVFTTMLAENNNDIAATIPKFARRQKPNGDAIQWLSMHNYIVMRDSTTKSSFLVREAFSRFLNTVMPSSWIPMYMMTAFHAEIPYADVIKRAEAQDRLLEGVLSFAVGAAALSAAAMFFLKK
eukprot:TRINITY_DN4375_c0_g1_i1.p1 TRINITY_DN4375_c0_g1~~TRINITY_DN4375_c0_g1_i1.p1  ORF type:complete len:384 (+),score=118.54 TRINITY_DN4375_c0_g1_i1:454-1605(+)